ncbi:hypothetical protein JHK82_012037 [Glycine max]|nr:hypothetical protein JHK85_012359 [Glycine max]KAG5057033.1 hypothetical protein JHK86_012029 [Glycine max]KAG5154068.1 hypothetical protein JHK82_012037 [Glycine max]
MTTSFGPTTTLASLKDHKVQIPSFHGLRSGSASALARNALSLPSLLNTSENKDKVQDELLSMYANQLLEKEHSGCHALLRNDKVKDAASNKKVNGLQDFEVVFLTRKKLARRPLFDKSANDDHERSILKKLKQQCGG